MDAGCPITFSLAFGGAAALAEAVAVKVVLTVRGVVDDGPQNCAKRPAGRLAGSTLNVMFPLEPLKQFR